MDILVHHMAKVISTLMNLQKKGRTSQINQHFRISRNPKADLTTTPHDQSRVNSAINDNNCVEKLH